jgi:hypothetical protein
VLASNGDLITPALDSTVTSMSSKLPAALGMTSSANSLSITFSAEDRTTQNSILSALQTAVTSLPHFALDANTGQAKVATITIPPFVATTTEIWVRLRTNTSTGGSAGGDPQFDRITINKIS